MSERQPIGAGGEQPQQRRRLLERVAQRFGLGEKTTPEKQPDKPRITSEGKSEGKIVISPKLQESNFDCGQTVLDMLGYKGHEMYPGHEISSSELRDIPGAREVTLPVGREEELDYNYPKVWIILGKDKVAGANHWVIRHKGKIYCPTIGEMDAEEYKRRYVSFVLQEFEIPVEGQQTPEEFYGQHGNTQSKAAKKDTGKDTSVTHKKVREPGEYGSREWAEWMARTVGEYDADWWYNCAGARAHRGES